MPIPELHPKGSFAKRKQAISDVLDKVPSSSRNSDLNDMAEPLDYHYAQVLTGYYGADYREIELKEDELKDLPSIGISFLKNQETLRDVEKAVATLYFAALSIGGETESIHGTKRWSTESTEKFTKNVFAIQTPPAYSRSSGAY